MVEDLEPGADVNVHTVVPCAFCNQIYATRENPIYVFEKTGKAMCRSCAEYIKRQIDASTRTAKN